MFTVTIDTDNAAFEDGAGIEVARILRDIAEQVEDARPENSTISVFDVNGNRVGGWKLVD